MREQPAEDKSNEYLITRYTAQWVWVTRIPNFGLSLGDPDGAGLDPIFWPFHANIDRAWSRWQEKHPGTEPKSEIWMKTQKFLFFDVMKKDDGSLTAVRVMMSGEQVLDTAKQLGYTYDNNCQNFELPPAPKAEELTTSVLTGAPREPLSVAAESHTTLAAEPVSVIIQITAEMQSRIDALVLAGAPPGSIVLTVGGLAVDRPTAASYGIYLDLPEGQVPNHGNGHYADELSFFGMGHHRHEDAHGGAMAPQDNAWNFDISDLVQSLADKGKWVRDQVTVTFANIAAGEPDRAAPPPASPDVRARFAYLKITVE